MLLLKSTDGILGLKFIYELCPFSFVFFCYLAPDGSLCANLNNFYSKQICSTCILFERQYYSSYTLYGYFISRIEKAQDSVENIDRW